DVGPRHASRARSFAPELDGQAAGVREEPRDGWADRGHDARARHVGTRITGKYVRVAERSPLGTGRSATDRAHRRRQTQSARGGDAVHLADARLALVEHG